MKAAFLAAAACVIVCFVVAWPTAPAQEKAKLKHLKWEYTIHHLGDVEHFNKLGDEGWELVTATKSDKSPYSFVFKRPKQ